MYKKILAGLMALAIVTGAYAPIQSIVGGTSNMEIVAYADDVSEVETGEYNGWEYAYYKDYGNTVYVYRYIGDETEVTLPSKINGRRVQVDPNTFLNGNFYGDGSIFGHSQVEVVNIPAEYDGDNYDDYSYVKELLFAGKTVKQVNVDPNNSKFASYDGMIFSKDMKYLYDCPEGKEGEITVPDGTEYIGICRKENEAFKTGAFEDCQKITKINFSDSVKEISNRTFRWCKGLKSVDLANAAILPSDYTKSSLAFSGCDSLESISTSNTNTSLTAVDDVLMTADKTRVIIIPARKDNVKIPASVVRFDFMERGYIADDINWVEYRFWNKSYTVDEDNQNFCSIDGALYTKDKKALIYYPAGVKNAKVADGTETIVTGAFFDKTDIESVVIPESVKLIDREAFLNCTNLNSVTLPDNAEISRWAIGYFSIIR